MSKLRVLDLFSGIGGFSLGLERTGGFETVAFCEIEEFPRKVLRKHWPYVPIFEDVRKLKGDDVGTVDVICGGFPCQDISSAGKKAGIGGIKSSLWKEYDRIIGEIRPKFVVVENSSALLNRGLDVVLSDLAARGYDAEWMCIPAAELGAPHGRDRLWLVAYTHNESEPSCSFNDEARGMSSAGGDDASNTKPRVGEMGRVMAGIGRVWKSVAWNGLWEIENSPIGMGVAHGVPRRMDRLRALGNAVVPQIPEMIGHAILEAEK